jgi:hypothetical protein
MSETAAGNPEFSFVESLPQAIAAEARTAMEAFKQVMADYEGAQKDHGLLVPITTVAESLGVTSQRVAELLDAGRMHGVVVTGRRWVVASSVVAYIQAGPRARGRPRKLSAVGNDVRKGLELAAAVQGLMK